MNRIYEFNNKKNLDIELMRFIMILSVSILHFSEDYGFAGIFGGGYLGVDFFFIIGGFYVANHYFRHKEDTIQSPARRATDYVKYRIKKIYIPYIVSLVIMTMFFVNDNAWSLIELNSHLYDVKWQFLFLHYLGASMPFTMRSIWYLSVFIFLIYTVYFLLEYNQKLYVGVSPILAILILEYICVNYGSLSMQWIYSGWIAGGILRGFAEMSIGVYLFFMIHENEKNVDIRVGNVLYWMKYLILFWIIYLMHKYGFDVNDFWILLLIIIYIRLSYVEHKEFIKSEFIRKIIIWLGDINLWMYLLHLVVSKVLCDNLPGKNNNIMLVIYLVLVIVVSSIAFLIERYIYYLFKKRRKNDVKN